MDEAFDGGCFESTSLERARKMAASLEVCHVACSANRAGPGVISWGRGTLLAFGSCRSVILYDPTLPL
uniref:Uncharacterized protein n=1 Tax=Pseudonaja textilis TaxID=8673 RepID=A0A670Y8I3_PSETE